MPTIRFIQHDGSERSVEASSGQSLMQAAVENMVPGILADCGGGCACATCHSYVDDAWLARLPAPSDDETMMLDGSLHTRPNSRLSCQVKLSDELDGMIVRLPASQF